ncbi:shikimate kinase [Fluviicola sp.]|jgi:shikimate kinase|uniref:shikimate kinase n=1 Tax=Fluviicola sp. TaxID=1917219 RepID=UPI00281C87AE|nr:shikimate kinase [Fluviicola sp.]MDR0800958.1 shikimate kinase [Fluviicola sp.]
MTQKHIFLIGFMGSGKTTVGKLLAEQLQLPFVDSDHWIEERNRKSVNAIFETEGEAFFRDQEWLFLNEAANFDPSVISLGGGLPVIENALELINEIGVSVYLNVSLLTLIQRLKEEREFRPKLKGLSDAEFYPFVEALLSERVQFYKKARLFMPNERNKPGELVEKICKELNKLNFQFFYSSSSDSSIPKKLTFSPSSSLRRK